MLVSDSQYNKKKRKNGEIFPSQSAEIFMGFNTMYNYAFCSLS